MDNLDVPMLSQKQVDDVANGLKSETFSVLDDGHIILVDMMGSDGAICDAARVCYGAGIVKRSKDVPLIRYLMRHRHTTPFEMVEFKFRIRIPMDAWRQYVRHRTASINEYSTRYSEAISEKQKTPSDKWRAQSVSNNQGSGEFITNDDHNDHGEQFLIAEGARANAIGDVHAPRTIGEYLSEKEADLHKHVDDVYRERLRLGVAKEQARKDLTLSNYTEAYWKIDLHNLLHFLSLRMDSHAQREIREYALVIGEIVSKLVPVTWQAFRDYRFDALNLTRLDSEVIKSISHGGQLLPIQKDEFMKFQHSSWASLDRCRERDECLEKLVRLGMVV